MVSSLGTMIEEAANAVNEEGEASGGPLRNFSPLHTLTRQLFLVSAGRSADSSSGPEGADGAR